MIYKNISWIGFKISILSKTAIKWLIVLIKVLFNFNVNQIIIFFEMIFLNYFIDYLT